jgi:hypothetical protein
MLGYRELANQRIEFFSPEQRFLLPGIGTYSSQQLILAQGTDTYLKAMRCYLAGQPIPVITTTNVYALVLRFQVETQTKTVI